MSLPPEQINIKRRREEEPVDTLYIQSELHQTKRRFTDFVFQRVTISARDATGRGSPSPSHLGPAQRAIQSPRAVSNIHLPKSTNRAGGYVIPSVRATSPGAELREERRLAAARKQAEEKLKNALHSSPAPPISEREKLTPVSKKNDAAPASGGLISSTSSGRGSPALSGQAPSIRRFQISRTGTPTGPLRSVGGGVQKRRADGAVAVLVEKLRREPHSRRASMVADAAARVETSASLTEGLTPAPVRKRPVVNQAEKKWRTERQGAISAAKDHIAEVLEKGAQARQSNWDDESDRLARQFEQIALELDSEMDVAPTNAKQYSEPSAARPAMPKPPLKYQPRTPNKHRAAVSSVSTELDQENTTALQTKREDGGDSDEDYVYDTYIRHPLPESGLLTDPLSDLADDQEAWLRHHGIDTNRQDVGVIVITPEDEAYWEDFAEDTDDEDRWDSEDGDSNAENNPAFDYPDEELSWDDEEDDAPAAYRKYRHDHSDDEDFDWDGSGSEAASVDRFGSRYGRSHVESDEDW
ncbi:Iwr1 domain-containing protein [Aspergillus undulatus]|uniref:Iwr1 domain-containing protein n=1 Tax=Aspergillus undulatus TaxID=1810928 RepID=UPI003CCDA143